MSTQITENKRNQNISASTSGVDDRNVDEDIKNVSSIVKLTKSKKPIFAKANFSRTDFLTTEAKKAFIHLWKAFTKAPILRYFDLKRHIRIETDALGYAIDGVLSQMTLGQLSSNHMIHKNHSDFLKSEIS